LLLGIFHGVPATNKSVFDLPTGAAHIVLDQKNIEAVCSNEVAARHQICQTLMHELGHYFGMTVEQLKDVLQQGIRDRITLTDHPPRFVRRQSMRQAGRSWAPRRASLVEFSLA